MRHQLTAVRARPAAAGRGPGAYHQVTELRVLDRVENVGAHSCGRVRTALLCGGTGGQQREVGELNFGQRSVAGVDMIAGWKDCCTGDMNSCGCGAEGEKPGGSLACSGGLG